uniref:RILP-like protein 1 n=1 Tax=Caenorhabditis tropicalis TaxID=1561998 RepID=A0A1I7UHX2_9PELO
MASDLLLKRPFNEFILECCSSDRPSSAAVLHRPRKKISAFVNAMAAARASSPQSPSKHITVVDVYDLAASIGNDFEKLIDNYGNECVRGIMPKVISALETLEAMAAGNDRENEEIMRLSKAVERLEQEKHQRNQQHLKFEEELEQVEKTYRKDIDDLQQMVKNLVNENRNLSTTVSSLPINNDSPVSSSMREADLRMLLELKEMSSQQKDEIKALQKDVETYQCQVENLQNSIEKLIRQNEELLRKNASLQKQGRVIVEEKMEVLKRLEKTEESNIELKKLVKETDRACKDMQVANQDNNEPRFTLGELREVIKEKNILKGRVMELEEELEQFKPGTKKEIMRLDDDDDSDRLAPNSDNAVDEDDLPVYGPMPKEPDEKLHPWKYERKDSGVRKFIQFPLLQRLWSDGVAPPRIICKRVSSSTGSCNPTLPQLIIMAPMLLPVHIFFSVLVFMFKCL